MVPMGAPPPGGRIAAENPGSVAPFVHAVAPDVVTKYARPAAMPEGPAAKTWLARMADIKQDCVPGLCQAEVAGSVV